MEKERIQGYIRSDLYRWVREQVKESVFASESHAVERGLLLLRSHMEGKLLKK